MLHLLIAAWFVVMAQAGCPLSPTSDQTSAKRLPGDGGYRILISGDYDKYIPNAVYTISLQGPHNYESSSQEFQRFTLSVDSQHAPFNPAARVGFFQIFPDSLTEFNEDCVNTVSEVSDYPKSEVQVMWRAPASGSGCVIFTAMVMEEPNRWFAEDGQLSRTFCEMSPKETEKLDELRCCACDEARYKIVMEGIWSNATHPKNFPDSAWLTHFSDVVGASHETNFSFWGRDHIATDGFRQLAEWGSASGLEAELRTKAKYLRTYMKLPGLWYPHVNSNTSGNFKVDRKHPLLSVASMLGPSPDWVVGVSKLNLCQRDCTWIKGMTIDLYPWDAGTDNGISYMSPNSETRPRERMKPITTMYPEDPRSPFYDPSGKPMLPLARLYIDREEIKKKSCDERDLEDQVAEFNVPENTGDTERPECMTTEYSDWTACSVTCGKGLRMRTRAYRIPEKAAMMGCSRQLVSKEMCLAPAGECSGGSSPAASDDDSPFPGLDNDECETSDWTDWSECSSSCGVGFKTRWRRLRDPSKRKKCFHVSLMEKEKCMQPPCAPGTEEKQDEICKVTDWSDWSPCSATCGTGVKTRTRLLLVLPELQTECARKVQLRQQRPCLDQADCTFDVATAKGEINKMGMYAICMEKPEKGPCRGYFERWAFNPEKRTCVPFIYGGCRGNRNNFRTSTECSKTCDVVRETLGDGQPPSQSLDPLPPRHSTNDRLSASAASDQPARSLAPVDCVVSDWSPWTACSVTCGTGRVTSSRYITRQPANGGKPCPKRLQRRARCQLAPCDDY
ncbi:hypothetical protein TSAR_016796 [Trichomalopsis sarcophagae]|uniref:Spondin-1 n=1 Tax=Trichomalopsis sarcophagae TaxID=543379 RepID=A0A232ELX5_9HYME|nr:hypothetical protein TSAR_016796 [Trichomalopsis sarcophagae]